MKIWYLVLVAFWIIPPQIWSQAKIIEGIKEEINLTSVYDSRKFNKIDSLQKVLAAISDENLRKKYDLNRDLFEEYRVFKRDSAFSYGVKTKQLAENLNDSILIAESIIGLANISVSGGMYKEALDFLENLNPSALPENIQSLYYGLLGRCYSEMAEYSNLPYFSDEYNKLANKYRNKALNLTDDGTFFNSFLKAFMLYQAGSKKRALEIFENLDNDELVMHDKAIVTYMMARIYQDQKKIDKAIGFFAQSAILDIKTSTKENLSMLALAELLFRKDEFKIASAFIKKANDDAKFYGAQQRKISVGAILPLIESKVVQQIENQRKRLFIQNIIMSFLLIFVIILAIVIYSQVNKLKKAKKLITQAHQKLQKTNNEIVAVNEKVKNANNELILLNNKLMEANKIKEEYVGFFFTQDAAIFEKFRSFKLRIEQNLKKGHVEKVNYLISNYDLKKEKQKLLQNFDEAFIKLFPNFISEFNSLLKPDRQIAVKKGQLLNKELRIFALIRLGVNHNEIIAQILGYSVNSIYAYKTKIRKKSVVDPKDFDEKLLNNTTLKL